MAAAEKGVFPRNGVPANQAAPGAQEDVDATCDTLFYASKCNPRIDIQSLNSLISEIVNAVNCLGIQYDCSRLDNLCTALQTIAGQVCDSPEAEALNDDDKLVMCRPGEGPMRIDPSEVLSRLCFSDDDIPDMGTVCGSSEQLVLWRDSNRCLRFGRISQSVLSGQTSGLADVWPTVPPNTSGHPLPASFPTPNLYYDAASLATDGGVDTNPYNGGQYGLSNREAPGLDEARMFNSRIARFEGRLDCPRRYSISLNWTRQGNPTDFAVAAAARSGAYRRIRYRAAATDPWSPWLYNFSANTGLLTVAYTSDMTNLNNEFTEGLNVSMFAGFYELEVMYFGDQSNPGRWSGNTNTGGNRQPSVTLRPILT